MIRQLTENDLPLLADVMASWLKHTEVIFPIDKDGTIRYLYKILKDPTYAAFGLFSENEETIHGWILGQLTEYTFLCRKVISELAWYINPLFRGKGKELMQALIDWGKNQGAEYAISTILLSAGKDRGLTAGEALKMLGFVEFEKTYFKPI